MVTLWIAYCQPGYTQYPDLVCHRKFVHISSLFLVFTSLLFTLFCSVRSLHCHHICKIFFCTFLSHVPNMKVFQILVVKCVCTKIIIQRKFISCVESFLSDPSIMYFKQYGAAVLPHIDGLLKPRSFFLIILIIIKRSFSAGSAGRASIWPLELSLH